MALSYLRLSAGFRSLFRLRLPSNAPTRLVGAHHANMLSVLVGDSGQKKAPSQTTGVSRCVVLCLRTSVARLTFVASQLCYCKVTANL